MSEIETALERARDTKALEFGVGAMEKVPAMFNKLFPGKTAIVVADKNTYAVAGEAVYGYLKMPVSIRSLLSFSLTLNSSPSGHTSGNWKHSSKSAMSLPWP